MDRGSGYGPSMPPLVEPADLYEKLTFALFWLQGVTNLVKNIDSPITKKLSSF